MKTTCFRWFFLGWLLLPSMLLAQPTRQELPEFPAEKLEDFRQDHRFEYAQPEQKTSAAANWWKKFIDYLSRNFNDVFRGEADSEFTIFFYIFILAAILFAVFKLVGADASWLFGGKSKGEFDYQVEEENLHEIDFESVIREAREAKEYRKAVRLIYLYSLRLLSEGQFIDFVPGKTNYEYQQELRGNTEIAPSFQKLSRLFAYAWYGNFSVNHEDTDEAYATLAPLLTLNEPTDER